MTTWSPQRFRAKARADGASATLVMRAAQVGTQIQRVDARLPVILTLKHLCVRARVPYTVMRQIVERSVPNPYRTFTVRKRVTRPFIASGSGAARSSAKGQTAQREFRLICVPDPLLMKVQRWIDKNILRLVPPHVASVAYSSGAKLIEAARPHCDQRWLIKLDISSFFESISEIDSYRVFRSLGYQPLLSLELARICTRLGTDTKYAQQKRFLLHDHINRGAYVDAYKATRLGRLPQGAPTSPRLSNLVMRKFDLQVSELATAHGLRYTRYADDLCLSTSRMDFNRDMAREVIGLIYQVMRKRGLQPNLAKATVCPPGARKVVLGLVVNEVAPRLRSELKQAMRAHLYYLHKLGPKRHARRRGFTSLLGMYRHLMGLAAFAAQVEPELGQTWRRELEAVEWP